MNPNDYIKVENDILLNKNKIRWMKKQNDCFYICVKSTGCDHQDEKFPDKLKVCVGHDYYQALEMIYKK
jgi:hypothetical protein